ncbi:MAG: hypothetical protein ACI8V4_003123, partial [Ilumatobacter sp.]
MGFERLAFGDFSHPSLNYRDDEEMVVATIEPPEPYWRRRAM